MEYSYSFLILLLPFLSFLVLGLLGMKMKKPVAGLIGTAVLGVLWCMSLYTAYNYFFAEGRGADGLFPTVTVFNFTWMKFTELLTFNIGFRLTPISVMMLIVITTVSFMVHIYSFGYMAERDENYKKEEYEPGFQRFYAYLSLFTVSMLGLVVATNIFQMYLFWELVGVCSYLLIGFYYPKHAAVHASKKAFIVTRFADLFFLIGILFYSYYVGTFNYDLTADPSLVMKLPGAAYFLPMSLFLMFIGGAGKSAMFPLHIWLPDAMEGPTPVSALIHAATMVVAGVYQVAALMPIWVAYAPNTLHYIAYIAAFTAFYAAAVACCQSDIKRGLAFSTISQIAYMLTALGVVTAMEGEGSVGYMASLFHLFTHAMFKALLFLCSGAIIVIIGSNFKEYMGGLHKYMPITNICFLIGTIAISGFWPLAGFFSKDEIVDACFHFSPYLGYFMTLVSGMTAFYMFRLYYVIFWGDSYYEQDPDHRRKPAEVPFIMWGPLVFLSVISIFAGWIPFGTLCHWMVTLRRLLCSTSISKPQLGCLWLLQRLASLSLLTCTHRSIIRCPTSWLPPCLSCTRPLSIVSTLTTLGSSSHTRLSLVASLSPLHGSTATLSMACSTSQLGQHKRVVRPSVRGRVEMCASMPFGSSRVQWL